MSSSSPTSELFHAIGTRDTETSIFKFHWFDNKMMIIAFVVGFIGQIFVTEVPFLVKAFGTVSLSFMEWIIIILVCLTPLVVHELWCIKNKIFNKK